MRDDDDMGPEEGSGEANRTAFDRALFHFVEHGDHVRFEHEPIYGGRYSIPDAHQAEEAVRQAGFVRGRYFGQWYEDVLRLKRQERYNEALEFLLEIIDATERAQAHGGSPIVGPPGSRARLCLMSVQLMLQATG